MRLTEPPLVSERQGKGIVRGPSELGRYSVVGWAQSSATQLRTWPAIGCVKPTFFYFCAAWLERLRRSKLLHCTLRHCSLPPYSRWLVHCSDHRTETVAASLPAFVSVAASPGVAISPALDLLADGTGCRGTSNSVCRRSSFLFCSFMALECRANHEPIHRPYPTGGHVGEPCSTFCPP